MPYVTCTGSTCQVDILSWFCVLAGILRRGVKGRLGDASDRPPCWSWGTARLVDVRRATREMSVDGGC